MVSLEALEWTLTGLWILVVIPQRQQSIDAIVREVERGVRELGGGLRLRIVGKDLHRPLECLVLPFGHRTWPFPPRLLNVDPLEERASGKPIRCVSPLMCNNLRLGFLSN